MHQVETVTATKTSAPPNVVAPTPTAEDLRVAYTVAVRSRAAEEHIVRLASRGEVKFAIWGPGEEIHGTATATASGGVPGYSYLWNTGDTTAAISVSLGSSYMLTVTDQVGCQETAGVTITSAFGAELVRSARLFPNPTSGELWLDLQLAAPVPVELFLLDALGRAWMRRDVGVVLQERLLLDRGGSLPEGVYWVVLRSEGRMVYSGRVVVY